MTDTSIPLEKTPPQSHEAEQAALGAMLLERDAIATAKGLGLASEHFYREAHRIICAAIYELFDRHEPVDLIMLAELLKSRDRLDGAQGGMLYLRLLMEAVPTAQGISHYAGIVKAKAYQRALIKTADAITAAAYTTEDVDALQRDAEAKIMQAADMLTTTEELPDWHAVATSAIQAKVGEMMSGEVRGMRTTWPTLDTMLMPLREKQSLVIAARPGMGKTMFMLNLCRRLGEQGYPGIVFSAEMDSEQLIERDIIGQTGEWVSNYDNPDYLRTYRADVIQALSDTVEGMRGLPVKICDYRVSLVTIDRQIRQEKARRRRLGLRSLAWFAVDYLQEMERDGKAKSGYQEITELSRGVTSIMKEHRLSLILCSQLSRDCETRDIKRPSLKDLRESGQIEQDASRVLFLYRPAYYGAMECLRVFAPDQVRAMKDAPIDQLNAMTARYGQVTEIVCAKQRQGRSGWTAHLKFIGNRYRFDEMAAADWQAIRGQR